MNLKQREYLRDQISSGRIGKDTISALDKSPYASGEHLKDDEVRRQYDWLGKYGSVFGPGTLVQRWTSSGEKHWLELYRQDYCGQEAYKYHYDRGGGNLGEMTLKRALEAMEEKLRGFRMDGIVLNPKPPKTD